jgi:hypothetical protein
MPAILSQTILTKDGAVLQPKDIKVTSNVVWTCDSPRCAARHEKATELTWNEEEAQKDVLALPEGFFRIIKINYNPLDQNQAVAFCSPTCAKDYLTYVYFQPQTPKEQLAEQAEKLKINAAAKAAIDAENPQMKLPFPESVEKNAELLGKLSEGVQQ